MSEIGEREALMRMIEGLRQAEASARVIAMYRRDERWVFIATAIGQMIDKGSVMAVQKSGIINVS
jgi:hypothetical protein